MKLYRYDDRLWHRYSKYYYLREFELIKETEKGYWIQETKKGKILKKKWVRKNEKKEYAYKTHSEALYAYYRRKKEHIRHVNRNFHRIRRVIEDVELYLTSDGIDLDSLLKDFIDKEEMKI